MGRGPLKLLLTCEHASAEVPPGLDLGVGPEVLASHVAFDEGAAAVAAALADRAGAPLLAGRFTRLAADLNRSESNPEVIPASAFGVRIPGNEGLSPAARADRLRRFWRPHRLAVEAAAGAGPCLHLAIHSFTPALDPAGRAFDVGVLFDPARSLEAGLAEALLRALAAAGLDARPNAPYAGTDDGLTTGLRSLLPDAAYAGIEVELSQALLRRPGAPGEVAPLLDSALARVRPTGGTLSG